jgi:hypothetical protein
VTRRGALPVRPLPLALSGVLGVGAALVVACGGGSKLLPAQNASQLRSDFDAVAAAVSTGSCDTALKSAVAATGTDIAALPSTVDPRLTASLQSGVRTLTNRAAVECKQQSTTSTTTTTDTTPTVTQTTQTQTNTTPTQTSTTQTQTNTTPTQTNTTPTDTTPTDTTPTGATVPIVPDNGGGTPAPNGQTGQVRTSAGGATGAGGTGFGGGN